MSRVIIELAAIARAGASTTPPMDSVIVPPLVELFDATMLVTTVVVDAGVVGGREGVGPRTSG